MPSRYHVARDISYAYSAGTWGGRMVIKFMENTTGRLRLIRRADEYGQEVAQGRDFWSVMADRFGVSLHVVGGALSNIPKDGPLILIANHPYGILDGLMMGHILARTRGDFRILANHVFRKAEDLNRIILPISFDATKEAVKLNIKTRQTALNYLVEGGAIGVFPGGTVSTAAKPFAHPMDVEKLATMPHQEAIRRLSLTHPSDCCNSFSSSNDGKANRDDLRGNDSDDSALLLGREEGHQGDLSSP